MIVRPSENFEAALRYSEEDVARIVSFGIPFLDKSLKGILPTDLVLLAADTGCGKTELATTIALNATRSGKRVLYFALEAETHEIERRINFKLFSECYLRDNHSPRIIEFDDWLTGSAPEFESFTDEVKEKFEKMTKGLSIYYKTDYNFGVSEFEEEFKKARGKQDLVVVDHLHYFDIANDVSEAIALGRAAKRIRYCALQEKLPVVLLCHLRKFDDELMIPQIQDIYGSSDVYKNATKIIMLAPGDFDMMFPHLFETYVHAAKYRFKGGLKHYLGKIIFDSRTNQYDKRFRIGRYSKGTTQFQEITSNLPHWAKQ